jgi:hypothetical protein
MRHNQIPRLVEGNCIHIVTFHGKFRIYFRVAFLEEETKIGGTKMGNDMIFSAAHCSVDINQRESSSFLSQT